MGAGGASAEPRSGVPVIVELHGLKSRQVVLRPRKIFGDLSFFHELQLVPGNTHGIPHTVFLKAVTNILKLCVYRQMLNHPCIPGIKPTSLQYFGSSCFHYHLSPVDLHWKMFYVRVRRMFCMCL
ncbi:hypothetical protein CapIbe_016199 [Capra ibex]